MTGLPLCKTRLGCRRSATLLCVVAIIVGDCRSTSFAAASPLTATVCEIFEHPEQFDNRLIRVTGLIRSDGLEHTLIEDLSCPKVGIALQLSAEGSKSAAAKRLLKEILFSREPGTTGKRISATLTGRFVWKPADGSLRSIIVDQISNLSITRAAAR
jgi:hypothetical protein